MPTRSGKGGGAAAVAAALPSQVLAGLRASVGELKVEHHEPAAKKGLSPELVAEMVTLMVSSGKSNKSTLEATKTRELSRNGVGVVLLRSPHGALQAFAAYHFNENYINTHCSIVWLQEIYVTQALRRQAKPRHSLSSSKRRGVAARAGAKTKPTASPRNLKLGTALVHAVKQRVIRVPTTSAALARPPAATAVSGATISLTLTLTRTRTRTLTLTLTLPYNPNPNQVEQLGRTTGCVAMLLQVDKSQPHLVLFYESLDISDISILNARKPNVTLKTVTFPNDPLQPWEVRQKLLCDCPKARQLLAAMPRTHVANSLIEGRGTFLSTGPHARVHTAGEALLDYASGAGWIVDPQEIEARLANKKDDRHLLKASSRMLLDGGPDHACKAGMTNSAGVTGKMNNAVGCWCPKTNSVYIKVREDCVVRTAAGR